MEYLDRLGDFAANLQYASLPATVQEHLGWILADTLAAVVGGAAEPELKEMTERVAFGTGSTLPGQGRQASAQEAALINGTAGTFLEMDEGNRYSRGHPAIHVLPAVMALAEVRASDSHTFLAALAAGYEIGSRFGAATQLRPSMHPHGTWGTLGAAGGCARLLGADATGLRDTLNMAASMSIATTRQPMLQGGLVRNLYAGLANSNGMLAAQLVPCGYRGERDGPASLLGQVVSDRFDPTVVVAALGEDWHLLQNYFKLHSCCRFNHGTLDALDLLAQRGALPAADTIASVEVRTYGLAVELDDPAPHNTLAAKFSVPFAVATRIVHGSSGMAVFTWDAVRRPDVLALAAKVRVQEDPAMSRRLPRERPAHVRITDCTGQIVEAEVATNRGDDAAPYSAEELSGKFLELCERVWPHRHAQTVLDATLSLGHGAEGSHTRMQQWLKLLQHPATR